MKESKKDYSLDKPLKYYSKFGMWFERLPLEYDDDDFVYAGRAIARVGDWKCPYCMNRCGDHTVEELMACLRTEKERVKCPSCGKLDELHLDDEYNACMRDRPVLKKATPSARP